MTQLVQTDREQKPVLVSGDRSGVSLIGVSEQPGKGTIYATELAYLSGKTPMSETAMDDTVRNLGSAVSPPQECLPSDVSSALRNASWLTRYQAALALSRLPSQNSEAVFKAGLSLLRDPSSQVRLKALDLLGADPYRTYAHLDSKQAELAVVLAEAVRRDPEAGVRSRAVAALSVQGRDGLNELLDLANNKNESVRFDVAWALLRFRDQPAALQSLRRLETDPCPDVSKVAKALLIGY